MSVTLNFLDSLKGTYISHSAGHVSCNFHVHAHKDIGLTVCIQVVAGLPEPGPVVYPFLLSIGLTFNSWPIYHVNVYIFLRKTG